MMILRLVVLAVCLVGLTSACGGGGNAEISIEDAWVRAVGTMEMETEGEGEMANMEGINTAAYMVIKNGGGEADRLVGAASETAEAAEIHLSEMEGEVMKMQPVEGVDIPAGGRAELKPGDYHIMLIGVKEELKAGDVVALTLEFETSGEQTVEAEVRAP